MPSPKVPDDADAATGALPVSVVASAPAETAANRPTRHNPNHIAPADRARRSVRYVPTSLFSSIRPPGQFDNERVSLLRRVVEIGGKKALDYGRKPVRNHSASRRLR